MSLTLNKKFYGCLKNDFINLIFKTGSHNSLSTANIYKKLKQKIEKLSTWSCNTMISATIFVFLIPSICVSFVNYYVYDMDDESFDLAVPMKYIIQMKKSIFFYLN